MLTLYLLGFVNTIFTCPLFAINTLSSFLWICYSKMALSISGNYILHLRYLNHCILASYDISCFFGLECIGLHYFAIAKVLMDNLISLTDNRFNCSSSKVTFSDVSLNIASFRLRLLFFLFPYSSLGE